MDRYHPLQNSIAITGMSGCISCNLLKMGSGFVWKFAVCKTPGSVPPIPSPGNELSEVNCKQSNPLSRNVCRISSKYSLLFGSNELYSFSSCKEGNKEYTKNVLPPPLTCFLLELRLLLLHVWIANQPLEEAAHPGKFSRDRDKVDNFPWPACSHLFVTNLADLELKMKLCFKMWV